jgi:small subunit ribosomal protein S6
MPKVAAGAREYFLTNTIIMATPMQSYELVVIFTPVLADEEFRNLQTKFAGIISENGGTVAHQEPWGMRSMAYPIQKKTTGLYWLVQYDAPSELNAKVEIQLNRDENVMRHMVTRLDKYAKEYNNKRRNKASQAAAEPQQQTAAELA